MGGLPGEANGRSVPDRTPTYVPITSGFLLTIEEPDQEPLDTVLERLQRQCQRHQLREERIEGDFAALVPSDPEIVSERHPVARERLHTLRVCRRSRATGWRS